MSNNSRFRLDPRIVQALVEFERSWSEGSPLDIREFASRHGELAPLLLRELVLVDFGHRWKAGREVPVEVHLNRFPELREDDDVVLALIASEIRQMPGEPDEAKYLERFPRYAGDVQLLFRVRKDLDPSWSVLSVVASRDSNVTIDHEPAPPRADGADSTVRRVPEPPRDGDSVVEAAEASPGPTLEDASIQFTDRFQVRERVGEGSFKRVYKALQVSTDRYVVIKVPLDPECAPSMLDEARVLAQFDHQNIPPVLALAHGAGRSTILAEKLITGRPWSDLLQEQRARLASEPADRRTEIVRFDLERNLEILLDVCDALRYTHQRLRVIHRDIKPQNVMLGEYGEVYLVDWGLALHVSDQADTNIRARHRSRAYGIGGTVAYMAPEMAKAASSRLTTATDVFLLGAVLYEVLTGTAPYADATGMQALFRAMVADIKPPERLAPDRAIPPELSRIALRAMAVDPDDRYPDASQFARAVRGYLRHATAEEQCRRAGDRLEKLKAELSQPRRIGPPQAGVGAVNRLIGIADQFRQAGEAWHPAEEEAQSSGEPTEKPQRDAAYSDDAGYRLALKGERDARLRLIRLAEEETGDYGLAEAQLDLIQELPPPYNEGVAKVRARVHKAAVRRRRTRTAARVASVAALCLLIVSALLYSYSEEQRTNALIAVKDKETAEARARLKAEQQRVESEQQRVADLLTDRADQAGDLRFQQGEARYLADAVQARDDPTRRVRWLEVMQRSLIPVRTSSRRLQVGCLAISPDGKRMVSGDLQGKRPAIRVWDLDDRTMTRVLRGHTSPDEPQAFSAIRRLVFRPDRPNELISAGLDGTIRLWDLAAGAEEARYPQADAPPLPQVLALDAISADGRCRVIFGDLSGKLTWCDLVLDPDSPEQWDRFIKVAEGDGHKLKITAVRFHPKGTQAASVGEDGVVRIWNSAGKPAAELVPADLEPERPDHHLNDVAYSPDGAILAAARKDGAILIWDVATWRLARTLRGHEIGPDGRNWVMRLDFPSPTRLFSTGTDGTVREWDPTTGRAVAIRGRHDRDLFGGSVAVPVAVDSMGRRLASAGSDGTIRLWDAQSDRLTAQLEGSQAGSIFACTASASLESKDLLITAGSSRDSQIRAWDTASLRERRTYVDGVHPPGDEDPSPLPIALAIAPDGSKFVTGHVGGDLIVWNTETGKRLATIAKAHSFPTGLASAPGALWQGGVSLTLKTLGQIAFVPIKPAVAGLAWSRDGRRFASVGADRLVKVWDAAATEPVASWKIDDPDWPETSPFSEIVPSALGIAFDRDGSHLILPGFDRFVRIREVESGKIVARLTGHTEPVTASVLDAGGALLATASADGRVIVWDAATRRPLQSFEVRPLLDGARFGGPPRPSNPVLEAVQRPQYRMITSLAFSPNSRLLAVGSADASVSLVELFTGRILHRGIGHEPTSPPYGHVSCYFSRDGLLVTVGSDGAIRCWDLAVQDEGAKVVEGPNGPRDARQIAVSQDGKEWAVVTASRQLVRWDRVSGKELGEWFNLEGDRPGTLAYSPDGRRLVVGAFSGKGVVLDRATGRTLAVFQAPKKLRLFGGGDPEIITTVAVDPTGKLAATNRNDDHVDLWTLDDGKLVKSFSTGKGRACRLAFRPEGPRQLAASDEHGRLIVWDLDASKPVFDPVAGPQQTGSVGGLAYSRSGSRLVQVGFGEAVVVWDADTGRRVQSLRSHDPSTMGEGVEYSIVRGVAFSPDGTLMSTCGNDGAICLWDARDPDAYSLIAVRATTRIASYRALPPLRLPGQPKQSAGEESLSRTLTGIELICIAFSHDGKQVLASGFDRNLPLQIFDVEAMRAPIAPGRSTADILAETERLIGLRLQSGNLAPIERNHLVPAQVPPAATGRR